MEQLDIRKASYSAANRYPFKLASQECFRDGKIMPVHIQLCPTNQCNMDCSFCSCSNLNKDEELPFGQLAKILMDARECGCRAVTITGGGESLLYPHIRETIALCRCLGIQMGLVTNGYFLGEFTDILGDLTWVRVSLSDETLPNLFKLLWSVMLDGGRDVTDWSLSYVVSEKPELQRIKQAMALANECEFTHVRLVLDLLEAYRNPGVLAEIKAELDGSVDDSRVIYQPRSEYTRGTRECYISLLKPIVAADGWIYPCCGVQYADKEPSRSFPEHMRMIRAVDIKTLFKTQAQFDGRDCYRCYYAHYNEFLALKREKLKHPEFV